MGGIAARLGGGRSRFGGLPGLAAWGLAAAALSVLAGIAVFAWPMAAVDVAVVAFAAGAVLWQPYAGLLALVVMYVFVSNDLFYPLLTIAGAGVASLIVRARTAPARVVVPLTLFLAVTLPTVPLHPSRDEGAFPPFLHIPHTGFLYSSPLSLEMHQWIGVCAVLSVLALSTWAVRSARRLDLLVGVVLVTSLYPLGVAADQYVSDDLVVRTGQSDRFAAVRGPFDHPNYFAFYLLVVVALAVMTLLRTRALGARAAIWSLLAASSAALFLTYTRSAWIALALVILLMGLIQYRVLLLAGVLLLALAALAFPGAARKAQDRFGDLSGNSSSSSSWEWRTGQWDRMMERGWERPVLGHGFGGYEHQTVAVFGVEDRKYKVVDAGKPAEPWGFSAHNDYVKLFVETGLVGLALWVAVLIGLIGTALRARRAPPARAVGTTMAAVLLGLVVIAGSDNVQVYSLVLVLVAALTGGAWGVASAERRRGSAAGHGLDARLVAQNGSQHLAST